ncbi:hypothetical protein CEXT_782581 [Caerostris extrusa]|uniref:Uncharacterized protein n=1 Tax=Caerostris extrusa TaxID=172846 RepID=A0AAV4QL31_CAEEX|nr:hypothetical protein CEXT_782581 [Caerostris extrusa]
MDSIVPIQNILFDGETYSKNAQPPVGIKLFTVGLKIEKCVLAYREFKIQFSFNALNSVYRQDQIEDRKNRIRIRKKSKSNSQLGKMTPLLSTALLFWCEIRIVGVKN